MFPFASFSFKPDEDIPSLDGKTIVVTGANSGLGLESLIHMAKHSPAKIYLCARSKAKYDTAMEHISKTIPDAAKFVHHLELDLQSLASVKQAAETFKAENDRLDILMNNAGIMATPPSLTADGYEVQFGTNHIGHALLTKLLLPTLQSTASQPKADVRIISLTSEGHKFAPKAGFLPAECTTDMATYSTWMRYGQSKLANILFSNELARRYPAITSVAVHPGVVATNLSVSFEKNHPWLGVVFKAVLGLFSASPSVGSYNQTWAATAPVVGKENAGVSGVQKSVSSGWYYTPVAKGERESAIAKNEKVAGELWEWTMKELESKGY